MSWKNGSETNEKWKDRRKNVTSDLGVETGESSEKWEGEEGESARIRESLSATFSFNACIAEEKNKIKNSNPNSYKGM